MPITHVERRTQIMGMSASQARLLSITARLTNNEFRSQTITNSKLRLATESEEASQKYMDALSQKQLQFMYYDNNGNAQKVPLTPIFLSTYAPMKNQYSVVNSAGKILVSNTDATNFEETDDLADFLDRYGLLIEKPDWAGYEAQMAEYNAKYAVYLGELEVYNIERADYLVLKRQYDLDYADYLRDLAIYQQSLVTPDLYDMFTGVLGTSDAPLSCYANALNGYNPSCYIHVLAHLIDWPGDDTVSTATYTATNGGTFTFTTNDVVGSAMHSIAKNNNFKAISDEIALQRTYCDGDDDLSTPGQQNLLADIINGGGWPTDKDFLMSDYLYDAATGTFKVKTLYQKAIDLAYMLKNNMITDPSERKALLINFTDGDMKKVDLEEPIEPEKPIPPEAPVAPVPPEPPSGELKVKDQEETQWYVNLWYKMNGSDTANLVRSKQVVDTDDPNSTNLIFVVMGCGKDQYKSNYERFDDNLYANSEWLEFALEQGIVTLEQARYYNPSANSGKVPELTSEAITWQGIIHTEAGDIISVDDEKAIAIAEAKYKKEITEIQNKDKKYDQDLKKLDTEHNALQTEYESIKEVISKNTERSFKAFS